MGVRCSAGVVGAGLEELPAAALARQAFGDLERWLSSPLSLSQDLGLPDVERETERRGRELLRLQLQAHIDGRGTGDLGPLLHVSVPGALPALYTHKRLHTRHLVTLFGRVTITRMAYGKPGQPSIHPLDAALQLPGRLYSYEMQRRLVKAAVQGPFDEAVEILTDATGVAAPKRTAEQIVQDASADFESFYNTRRAACCEAEGPIVVAAIDSKGIPLVKLERAAKTVRRGKGKKRQKKRMSSVAAVFTQLPEPRTPEEIVDRLFTAAQLPPKKKRRASKPLRKRVWASLLADKDRFMADVRAEMLRRDPGREKKAWVIVTDGERGLQHRVCNHFEDATLILDLLHVLEKLWKAAHALYAEGSAEAEIFVRQRALRILQGEVSQVVKGLRQIVTKRKLKGVKAKAVLGAAGYFHRNKSRMSYDLYLKKGWPIASGSVEGACKNLIKDRMERSGMRWTPTMAESMLRLRAIYLSGDFDEYWEYHVLQDQLRLYPEELLNVVEK
jgi:hypothetical protein